MSGGRRGIDRLALVGVGLIGGSLALALREAGYCGEIVGFDRNPDHLEEGRALGLVDRAADSVAGAVEGADMIVLAVPMRAMTAVLGEVAEAAPAEAVITDVGSVKSSVVAEARERLGAAAGRFVAGHPIAGRERSGPEAAEGGLFRGRRVLLTPVAANDPAAVRRVEAMWHAAGAAVERMAPEHHDHVLAATSHLPHMLAYALVDCLAAMDEQREIFRYAAGGFSDFTRIASSDPVMWRDICLANRDEILGMVARFRDELDALAGHIRDGDGEAMLSTFARAKQARDRFCEGEG